MVKEFKFKGKTVQELKKISIEDFSKLIAARERRKLNRGFSDAEKKLLERIKAFKQGKKTNNIKTHCRDMVVIPEMLDLTIHIYNGKAFMPVIIIPEMLGHRLGEYALTRQRVVHSAPGIGATRSSAFASVK